MSTIALVMEDTRTNRANHSYRTLRSFIVRGGLSPGTRLREARLARELNVSRTPVREALARLEQEGFVSTHRGAARREAAIVAPLTKSDARELFYLVGALEGVAARLVAQFPRPERRGLCETLEAANAAFESTIASSEPDSAEVMAADRAFHKRMMEAAAAHRLLSTWEVLKPHTLRYTWAYSDYFARHAGESAREHAALVEAIHRGDPDEADRAASRNYWNGADRICTVMTIAGEQR